MKPLISIVIPTYNRAPDLERALKSVFAQTYPVWEVLIVDNHSNDNTDNLIGGLDEPRIKLLKIHNDGIIAASRNKGVRYASGEYIAFLDSDDWWLPTKLEQSLKCLEQGADVVYHDLFLAKKVNQKYFWTKIKSRNLISPVFNDLIINGNTLSNSSVVIRRDILEQIDGFSEEKELVAAEDYDGWLRAAKITEKFRKINKTLGYYWVGSGNMSNPRRTLQILEAMASRYPNTAINLGQESSCYLHIYIKGRAYYKLKSYHMAKKNFKLVNLGQAPYIIYAKSIWMLLLINIYYIPKYRIFN